MVPQMVCLRFPVPKLYGQAGASARTTLHRLVSKNGGINLAANDCHKNQQAVKKISHQRSGSAQRLDMQCTYDLSLCWLRSYSCEV